MDKLIYNAFEDIREFIVYNDIEITSKDDLIELFVKMNEKGYFYKVKENNRMRELKMLYSKFANYFEEDRTILDPVLIINGPRVLLEKLENYQKKKKI